MACEILERNQGADHVALVGLQTGGVPLARRLGGNLEQIAGDLPPVGTLDLALHRDDIGARPVLPEELTDIPFDVDGRTMISFATTRYRAGVWLAGQDVGVVCDGGFVHLHHRGRRCLRSSYLDPGGELLALFGDRHLAVNVNGHQNVLAGGQRISSPTDSRNPCGRTTDLPDEPSADGHQPLACHGLGQA